MQSTGGTRGESGITSRALADPVDFVIRWFGARFFSRWRFRRPEGKKSGGGSNRRVSRAPTGFVLQASRKAVLRGTALSCRLCVYYCERNPSGLLKRAPAKGASTRPTAGRSHDDGDGGAPAPAAAAPAADADADAALLAAAALAAAAAAAAPSRADSATKDQDPDGGAPRPPAPKQAAAAAAAAAAASVPTCRRRAPAAAAGSAPLATALSADRTCPAICRARHAARGRSSRMGPTADAAATPPPTPGEADADADAASGDGSSAAASRSVARTASARPASARRLAFCARVRRFSPHGLFHMRLSLRCGWCVTRARLRTGLEGAESLAALLRLSLKRKEHSPAALEVLHHHRDLRCEEHHLDREFEIKFDS